MVGDSATRVGACKDSKVAGGLMNSVAGFDDSLDWQTGMHPVCGKIVG